MSGKRGRPPIGLQRMLRMYFGLFMQAHDLLAPLVEGFEGLLSCVFFFHDL